MQKGAMAEKEMRSRGIHGTTWPRRIRDSSKIHLSVKLPPQLQIERDVLFGPRKPGLVQLKGILLAAISCTMNDSNKKA